jgi:uncharacterized membrane protein
MTTLTAEDSERGITWNPKIAAELFEKDAVYRDEGKERCWGSLHICRQTGLWYDHAAAIGGLYSVPLIRFLKKRAGEEWSAADAAAWLKKFLEEHDGTGQLEAEDEDWTTARREATAALAKHYLDTAEPLPEDGAERTYLASRALTGPFPAALRRVPNARPGESALVMPLTAYGRVTGVLLTYIDALGRKSLVLPNRRRLDIGRAPGAVMEIATATPGTVDISADVVICEGLENGLSINLVKSPAWRVIALPGISVLKNVALKPEERRVIVFQDSDPKGHPACEGLDAGVDTLLLGGKEVRVTEDSEHGDANNILKTEELGEKELRRLLAKPAGAALSFKGKVEELSKLPETAYMQARRETAKGLGVPVAYLDREVTKRRPKPVEAEQPSTPESGKPPGNHEAAPRPPARPRRAKPNGPAAESRPAPQLDLPEPPPIAYAEGSIAEEIRQLHAANPKRSLAWIAKQSGQPRSIVREILGNGEGA